MRETNTTQSFVAQWGGILFSIALILVPAGLLAANVWPAVMLGAVIGATVRLGTDLLLLVLVHNSPAADGGRVPAAHLLSMSILLLTQFGTLIVGAILAVTGSSLGLGIVGVMIVSYLFAIGYNMRYSTDAEFEGEDDSEWTFDIDDV